VQARLLNDPRSLPRVVVEDFLGIHVQITHATNSGAAWGIFSDFPHFLVVFRLLLIASLIVYLIAYNTKLSWQLPLVCIVTGALGNVLDYFLYGSVVDMIQINFWGYDYPVFNVADSAIFIGSFWLLILSLFEKTNAHDKPPENLS
jgi:signal peptidase II